MSFVLLSKSFLRNNKNSLSYFYLKKGEEYYSFLNSYYLMSDTIYGVANSISTKDVLAKLNLTTVVFHVGPFLRRVQVTKNHLRIYRFSYLSVRSKLRGIKITEVGLQNLPSSTVLV